MTFTTFCVWTTSRKDLRGIKKNSTTYRKREVRFGSEIKGHI